MIAEVALQAGERIMTGSTATIGAIPKESVMDCDITQ
jgi:hypothetical protein